MKKIKCKIILVLCFTIISVFYSLPLYAEEVEDLKQQIEALQQRLDELESKQSQPSATSPWGFSNRGIGSGWDPFAEMQRMQDAMDQMFQNSFSGPTHSGTGIFSSNLNLSADIDLEEKEDSYEIHFDMQGLDQEKVDIQVNQHSITVKGEQSSQAQEDNPNGFIQTQSYGTFMKTIPLPVDADTSQMKTEKQGDVLIIKLPKKTS